MTTAYVYEQTHIEKCTFQTNCNLLFLNVVKPITHISRTTELNKFIKTILTA